MWVCVMSKLGELHKEDGKKTLPKQKKTLFVIAAVILVSLISLTLVGGFITYKILSNQREGPIIEETTSIASTTLISSTTSSTTSTLPAVTTSSSTSTLSTTTSTSTTTLDGIMCSGKKVSESLLSADDSIPEGTVRSVFCIQGFSHPRSYANKIERLRDITGIQRVSITYNYPIGYVIYNPDEVTLDKIISMLGDYTVNIIKDGIH